MMPRVGHILASLALVTASSASAQMAIDDNRLLTYSGYLEDGLGPVHDDVELRVALFTSTSGAAGANDCLRDDFSNCGLWQEELAGVQVSAGRFSVVLGRTSALLDSDLVSDGLWVALAVKGTG